MSNFEKFFGGGELGKIESKLKGWEDSIRQEIQLDTEGDGLTRENAPFIEEIREELAEELSYNAEGTIKKLNAWAKKKKIDYVFCYDEEHKDLFMTP